MALCGIEHQERAGTERPRLPVAAELGLALDHRDPRSLAQLMVAELAARLEQDEDSARIVLGVHDDGRRRLEALEIP
jgi:hypothetical protein